MAKMTLKVKVNDSYFHYQLRVSQEACEMAAILSQPEWVNVCITTEVSI